MPRKARIDAPGAIHHIIGRGIEGCKIFRDDADRDGFVDRLGRVISETHTICYGWALIPNHFHLLLRSAETPISTVMRKLLTGYAVSFNRRYKRSGHLFQNRYKSILCQEDPYFMQLVRYIHLNPLRALRVTTMNQLDRHRYCGHSAVMGKAKNDWQDTETVLSFFGKRVSSARRHYREYIEKGIALGKQPQLTGGGLIRSAGGWQAFKSIRNSKIHVKGDERILGDGDFVASVLEHQNERLQRRYRLQAQGINFDKVVKRVAQVFKLKPEQIINSGKQRQLVKARRVVCYLAVKELEMSTTQVANLLHVRQPTVSRAVTHGQILANELNLNLESYQKV